MTRINPLDLLSQAVRSEGVAKARSRGAQTAARGSSAPKSLKDRLRAGLHRLDFNAPGVEEQALALFVDAVLAEDYGADFLLGPTGQDLSARVRGALMEDARCRDAVMEVLGEVGKQ